MKKIFFLFLCGIALLGISSSRSGAQAFVSAWHMPNMCTSLSDSGGFMVTGYTSADSIVINFGDGTTVGFPPYYVTGTGDTAYYYYSHYYSAPGTYTVTIFLSLGGVLVDTLTYTRIGIPCNTIVLTFYADENSNCTQDAGEYNMFTSAASVKIDSAGVPIDTITSNWGTYYNAYGPVGTVYTFTVITNPPGFLPTCPSSGVSTFTITSTSGPYSGTIGFECDPAACLDNSVIASVGATITGAKVYGYFMTSSCSAVTKTATLTFSPKYTLAAVYGGASYTVSGNVATLTTTLSATSPRWVYATFNPVGTLTLGDTASFTFATSVTGDCNTSNNSVYLLDTLTASYDPNDKSVKPAGNIAAGTQLEYHLRFENTGNGPAENIHILDTLSDNLDINTIKQKASSAPCKMILLKWAGHNIVKFDFPGIQLADSSHHPECQGFVSFTINAKASLTPGTHIDNRAGIYFDSNPVVMTNNVRSSIPIPGAVTIVSSNVVEVYPNPVNDILTVKAINGSYNTVTIANMMGQTVMQGQLDKNQSDIYVKLLPPGMYLITLRGESGVKVQKFEKL